MKCARGIWQYIVIHTHNAIITLQYKLPMLVYGKVFIYLCIYRIASVRFSYQNKIAIIHTTYIHRLFLCTVWCVHNEV